MDENDNCNELIEIIQSIGDNLEEAYREYTEIYVKRIIREAENNNEDALAMLDRMALHFRQISDSFSALAGNLTLKQLH